MVDTKVWFNIGWVDLWITKEASKVADTLDRRKSPNNVFFFENK